MIGLFGAGDVRDASCSLGKRRAAVFDAGLDGSLSGDEIAEDFYV